MAYTQVQIGNVLITRVIEQHTLLSPDDYFPTGSIERLVGHGAWLKPWALDRDDQLKFVIQALCVQDGDQKIIVDTCVGPRTLPEAYAFIVNDGSFIDTLTQAGFGRDEVDLVICTHLHFDHVGWNTILEDGNWVPTFRRARYVVARPEFEHWQATTPEIQGIVKRVQPGRRHDATAAGRSNGYGRIGSSSHEKSATRPHSWAHTWTRISAYPLGRTRWFHHRRLRPPPSAVRGDRLALAGGHGCDRVLRYTTLGSGAVQGPTGADRRNALPPAERWTPGNDRFRRRVPSGDRVAPDRTIFCGLGAITTLVGIRR